MSSVCSKGRLSFPCCRRGEKTFGIPRYLCAIDFRSINNLHSSTWDRSTLVLCAGPAETSDLLRSGQWLKNIAAQLTAIRHDLQTLLQRQIALHTKHYRCSLITDREGNCSDTASFRRPRRVLDLASTKQNRAYSDPIRQHWHGAMRCPQPPWAKYTMHCTLEGYMTRYRHVIRRLAKAIHPQQMLQHAPGLDSDLKLYSLALVTYQ
jgi:hypothetical protein